MSPLPSLCQGLQAPSGQQLRDKKGEVSNARRSRALVTPTPPLPAEAVVMLEVEKGHLEEKGCAPMAISMGNRAHVGLPKAKADKKEGIP